MSRAVPGADGDNPVVLTQRRRRTSRRLTFIVAAVALLPLGAMAIFTVQLAEGAVRNQAELRLSASAQASAVAVEQQMLGLRGVVNSYAQRPSLVLATTGDDDSPEDVELRRFNLDSLLDARPGIEFALIIDSDGLLVDIVPASPDLIGTDLSQQGWYQGVIEGNSPYVSGIHPTVTRDDRSILAAAAPIRSGPGSDSPIEGVLVAAYSRTAVQEFVDEFAAAQEVQLTVVDQAGAIVATQGRATVGDTYRGVDVARDAEAVDPTATAVSKEQDGTLVASAPAARLEWTVVAEVPVDTAFAEMDAIRTTVIATVALLVAAIACGTAAVDTSLRRKDRAEAELVRSELSVRETGSRLRLALDAARLATWQWDPETRLVAWSPELEAMYGLASGSGQGRGLTDSVLEDDRHIVVGALDSSFLSGSELVTQYRIRRPEGDIRWVSLHAAVERDADGGPVHVVGVAADVTDEQELLLAVESARDEANRANQMKNEFLSRMSHELRTPLNAVLGFSQLLAMDDLTPDQAENVELIRRGGSHLLDLINDVLDVARIEAGGLRLSMESIQVAEVLQVALDLISSQAVEHGLRIDVENGHDTYVHADRQRLLQVLLNLLSNAVKYNRPDGRIRVSCERSDGTVSISVSDTGMGLTADDMQELFTPFERLGAEHTEIEGTGVGLALSRLLAQQMGGSLTVASTLGSGSTFTIELTESLEPQHDERSADSGVLGESSAEPSDLQPELQILCIEDNVANLRLIERAVQRVAPIDLLTAVQGRLGVDLAARHRPDLVLLDLHLPDISGQEVLRRLRVDARTAAIPIVICTADATPHLRQRLIDLGATDLLTKPLDLAELFSVIERTRREQPVPRPSPNAAEET